MYKLYSATIELTHRCNAKCLHCIVDAGISLDNELASSEIIRLIEDLDDLGCEDIVFTGGEPFLRQDFPLFLQKAHSLNKTIVIMSNGLLIDDAAIKMLKLYDVSLGISLDGAKAETHNKIRGVDGIYEHLMLLIPKLKKAGIYTAISTTVMQSNLKELDKIKDLLLKLKVDSWQLQILKPCKRVLEQELLTEKQYYELAEKIVEYRKKYGKKMLILEADCIGYNSKLTPELYIQNWRGCECGIYSVSITANGDVKGCPNMNNTEGNIRERSFKDIWNDHNCFSYNRKPNIDNLSGYCNECEYKYTCRGGCPINPRTQKSNSAFCLHKIETVGYDS